MFKNEREMAIGLASINKDFEDSKGCIYKFVTDSKGRSPFQVFTEEGKWEAIDTHWGRFAELKISGLPNLPIDAKIFVKESESHGWKPRHFKKWNKQGDIICHRDTSTSFTEIDGSEYVWKFWKIDGGVHKGKTNYKQRNALAYLLPTEDNCQ